MAESRSVECVHLLAVFLSQGASRSSESSTKLPMFLLPSQQELMLQAACAAARRGVGHTPRFDEMKLRWVELMC